jgi:hypothetical protein
MNSRTALAALIVPFTTLVACTTPQQARPAIPQSNVEAHAEHTQAPATLQSGLNRITIKNSTSASADFIAARLKGDATLADFNEAAAGPMGIVGALAVVELASGKPGVPAGGTAEVLVDLKPGSYLFLTSGSLQEAAGPPNIAQVEVKQRVGLTPADPADTVIATAVDFDFSIPATLTTGTKTFQFVNNGSQWHEFVVFKLDANATVDDLLAALQSETPPLDPPFQEAGFIFPVSAGWRAFSEIALTPGNYVAVCFVPNLLSDEMEPHIAHGMIQEFKVQ